VLYLNEPFRVYSDETPSVAGANGGCIVADREKIFSAVAAYVKLFFPRKTTAGQTHLNF
jgi:hypothetical protein